MTTNLTSLRTLLDESAQSKSAAAGALGTERSSSANDVVLRASGVTRSFGGAVVLDGVSLELRQGEVVLLRGDNGSGKTTLLNILTGSLEPDLRVDRSHAADRP